MPAIPILLLLFLSSPRVSAEEEGELLVKVERTALPPASFKILHVFPLLRFSHGDEVPEGFDAVFWLQSHTARGYMGKEKIRFLLRGWERQTLELFVPGKEGAPPKAVPRLETSSHRSHLSFGPVEIEGLLPMTAHLYYGAIPAERWKGTYKRLYVLPATCLSGELPVGEKPVRFGLIDQNLNGRAFDLCTKNYREGDWIVIDGNGDGVFDVRHGNGEARSLTRLLLVGGQSWRVGSRDENLVLTPTDPPTARFRLDGFDKDASVRGWSFSAGTVERPLDEEGCFKVPRDTFRIYSYEWKKGDWTLRCYPLFKLGDLAPPDGDGLKVLEIGPAFRGTLEMKGPLEKRTFTFRGVGRADETLVLQKGKDRSSPTLVALDGGGKEVFRQAMKPG
jgi:hypothetical protein